MTAKRNPVIGWCTCAICGTEDALVSQERATELLYYNCSVCKCVRMKGGEFQRKISASLYLKGDDSPLSTENELPRSARVEPNSPLPTAIGGESGTNSNAEQLHQSEISANPVVTGGFEKEIEPEPDSPPESEPEPGHKKQDKSGWFEEL